MSCDPKRQKIKIERFNRIGPYLYKKKDILGKGAYANVHPGFHKETKTEVAIKIIPKSKLKTENSRKRLLSEIETLKLVSHHPNIPTFYESYTDSHNYYIVLERVNGIELYEYLFFYGGMKKENARLLFSQLAKTINFLHSKGICHRDIKIENLMISRDLNHIWLLDFGFARKTDPGEFMTEWCGSCYNAPPEIYRREMYRGFKYDAWTLGGVLYTMLKGSMIFYGNTPNESILKILKGEHGSMEGLPDDAKKLILRLIDTLPWKRPSIKEVLKDPWVLVL